MKTEVPIQRKIRRSKRQRKLAKRRVKKRAKKRVKEEGVSPLVEKYWLQRYDLFSKYDEGVKLDEEGWFSVTPEEIAVRHAERSGGGVVVDCFAGVGGNSIQFAKINQICCCCCNLRSAVVGSCALSLSLSFSPDRCTKTPFQRSSNLGPQSQPSSCAGSLFVSLSPIRIVALCLLLRRQRSAAPPPTAAFTHRSSTTTFFDDEIRCYHVVAIEIDPQKVEMALSNAKVYGVEDYVDFIVGDFIQLAPSLKGDTVFLSPPWGGPSYKATKNFTLDLLKPKDGYSLFQIAQTITPNIIMFLPRNVDLLQVEELSWLSSPPLCVEIEKNYVNSYLKGITVYFGDAAFGKMELS